MPTQQIEPVKVKWRVIDPTVVRSELRKVNIAAILEQEAAKHGGKLTGRQIIDLVTNSVRPVIRKVGAGHE